MQRFLQRLTLWAVLLFTFALLPAQAQTFPQKPKLTTLHAFDTPHGEAAQTALLSASDGNLYGVTPYGGLFAPAEGDYAGTVYRITPAGKFTTLWRFDGTNGAFPSGPLTEGADGALYGTTAQGGPQDAGTVFRITKQGRLTNLHVFTASDTGGLPFGGLRPAPDGGFYGTTASGGPNSAGTVFHITPAGKIATLHVFAPDNNPSSGVTQGADGALYGVTFRGGAHNDGTVYRLSPDGKAFSTLHSFNGDDGVNPSARLTLGPDSALYGAAMLDLRTGGRGLLYKVSASGAFAVLHRFSDDGHGRYPAAGLTLGADGCFYGTTQFGGAGETEFASASGGGTVFQMTPAGAVTTLYKFHTRFDGSQPLGGVVFGANGLLYGTTFAGGSTGGFGGAGNANLRGTVFSLSVPAVPN